MPEKPLIRLLDLQQTDAEYVSSEIFRHLCNAGYSARNMVGQCYNGASVISGVRDDVKALIQTILVDVSHTSTVTTTNYTKWSCGCLVS